MDPTARDDFCGGLPRPDLWFDFKIFFFTARPLTRCLAIVFTVLGTLPFSLLNRCGGIGFHSARATSAMSGLKKLRTTLDSLKLGSVHMSSPGTADALLSLDVDGELRMATDG